MIAIELPADAFLPRIDPHPDLVAATVPTSRQMAEAVGIMGLLTDADSRWFRPAVSA